MLTAILVVLGFAVDRVMKLLTTLYLKPISTIEIIPGIFSFTYVENRGAAWGMFEGQRWPLIIFTVCVCACLIWFLIRNYSKTTVLFKISMGLILAGALGNMFDRIVNGYVVDMLHATFIDYPVFNGADCMLVIGVILLGIYILFFDKVFFQEKNKSSAAEGKSSVDGDSGEK